MKKLLFSILSFLFFLGGCSFTTNTEEKYGEEINDLVNAILSNSAKIENMANTYVDLWSTSIDKGSGNITIKYVADLLNIEEYEVDNYFPTESYMSTYIEGDYNIIIPSLLKFYEENGYITDIKNNQEKINNKIKKLNNPPDRYKDVFDKVVKMYTKSNEYLELISSPSGSLLDFSNKRNNFSNEISKLYEEIQIYLPDDNEK